MMRLTILTTSSCVMLRVLVMGVPVVIVSEFERINK
jgi:hypothetical protein